VVKQDRREGTEMWEEWRAEIDRSLRDAQRTEPRWYDPDLPAALRDADGTDREFRMFRVISNASGPARRQIPRTWRLLLSASRARPIL
jgi:hypothetical protein